MESNKLIGYIVSASGLLVIVLSFFRNSFAFLPASISKNDLIVAGIILIIIGVVLSFNKSKSSSKIKQASEEVPIYEGEGKHRKIVAYKKESEK